MRLYQSNYRKSTRRVCEKKKGFLALENLWNCVDSVGSNKPGGW